MKPTEADLQEETDLRQEEEVVLEDTEVTEESNSDDVDHVADSDKTPSADKEDLENLRKQAEKARDLGYIAKTTVAKALDKGDLDLLEGNESLMNFAQEHFSDRIAELRANKKTQDSPRSKDIDIRGEIERYAREERIGKFIRQKGIKGEQAIKIKKIAMLMRNVGDGITERKSVEAAFVAVIGERPKAAPSVKASQARSSTEQTKEKSDRAAEFKKMFPGSAIPAHLQ